MSNYDLDTVRAAETAAAIDTVNRAKELSIAMKKEADKYTKLAELALNDYVNTVKHKIFPHYITYMLPDAMEWISMRKGKINKRKKYDEKTAYERVCEIIKEEITGKDVVIDDICLCGYETYGWDIKFTCADGHFALIFANNEALNVKNFYYAHEGMTWLGYYSSEHVMEHIAASYKLEDLKAAFAKFNEPQNTIQVTL